MALTNYAESVHIIEIRVVLLNHVSGKIIVAYNGVHQAYQLALAAEEIGELARFYCSVYVKGTSVKESYIDAPVLLAAFQCSSS
jgi:hypothetical protein